MKETEMVSYSLIFANYKAVGKNDKLYELVSLNIAKQFSKIYLPWLNQGSLRGGGEAQYR
jgi:hypothetical protein